MLQYLISGNANIIEIVVFVVLGCIFLKRRVNLPLPPGPPRIPFVGSVHLVPKERMWLKFAEWGKQYGDVIYLSALGKPMIILNSAKAAIDLLDRRGSIYANRPTLPMAGELIGLKETVMLCQYNARLRESRRLMSAYLTPRVVTENLHSALVQNTSDYLLRPLLHSPKDFLQHIRNTVAATIISIAYGRRIGPSDPLVDVARQSADIFGMTVVPGAFLVDTFPILRYVPDWFPGASFKRKAKEWQTLIIRLRDEAYLAVKDQVNLGVAPPSFAARLIQMNKSPNAEEELMYKWVTASFYGAGADTTVSALSTFFLTMVLYPKVQQKAQEEIEHAVGNTRLPTLADRDDLPYVDAIIKEVLRWSPVTPLALPHCSSESDEYAGYHIPKGSVVFVNSWAILHDASLYPLPFDFSPERFLSQNNQVDPSTERDRVSVNTEKENLNNGETFLNPDPGKFAFGHGRRACPGQYLAEAMIWIAVATTLSAFSITPALDANGNPEIPEVEYLSGIISHPKKFRCNITPRPGNASLVNLTTEAEKN